MTHGAFGIADTSARRNNASHCHESRIDALLDGKKALGALPFDDFGEQRALFTLNDEIAVDKSVPDLFGKQDARRTFPDDGIPMRTRLSILCPIISHVQKKVNLMEHQLLRDMNFFLFHILI